LNEFSVWSDLSWFQLEAASWKAALNFSDGSSRAGTPCSDTQERRDVASLLNLPTAVEESLGAYQTRHTESFPVPAELAMFLDRVKTSRPICSRLQRYVLDLGAEFEECIDIQKKQVTKSGEYFHKLHDALSTDLVNDRPIRDFLPGQAMQCFRDEWDRGRMREGLVRARTKDHFLRDFNL